LLTVFRWLNTRVLQFIDRRRDAAVMVRVQVQGDDLLFDDRQGGHHRVAMADIRRVVAVRSEAYAGDEAVLLIEGPGHAVLPAAASCAGWPELCMALQRGLPGALPFEQWHTQLLAHPAGHPIDVWPAAMPEPGTAGTMAP
jgi:hypothetical protein